jgi:hypothetical protein
LGGRGCRIWGYHGAVEGFGEDDRWSQGVYEGEVSLSVAESTFAPLTIVFAVRATIEEEYGKKLAKLSKQTLGRDETG